MNGGVQQLAANSSLTSHMMTAAQKRDITSEASDRIALASFYYRILVGILIWFAAFANLPIQIKPKVALVATGFTVLRQSFHLPHGS